MTMRMPPQLDETNRFFWTGGADGRLRFLQCEACARFVHPPEQFCPVCLSETLAPAVVPGTGTVDTYTVNHQKWRPDLDVPYVIARIAIDEAPGVILTSNIIGAAPDEVHMGDKVRVVFEQQDDIFFPLFEKER